MPPNNDTIEIHERLTRIETILDSIHKALEEQKECDDKQDKKLDKILHNDIDKLQRIARTEESIKNIKATLWVFVAPLAAGIAKWFI